MASTSNLEGGQILLGVEDDGRISGLTRTREEAERWVMDVANQNVQPAIIPAWRTVTLKDGKIVGVIGVPADSPGKPYKAKRGSAWVTFVRFGSTSREATRDQEGRLYQASHLLRYDIKPVLETDLDVLATTRLGPWPSRELVTDKGVRDTSSLRGKPRSS